MEELFKSIENTIRSAGYHGPVNGEEIYNEICDEIELKEPGTYLFMSKKEENTFFLSTRSTSWKISLICPGWISTPMGRSSMSTLMHKFFHRKLVSSPSLRAGFPGCITTKIRANKQLLFLCLNRLFLFLLQSLVGCLTKQCIQYGTKRNEYQHTYDAKSISANGYCDQNPDGRQTDGISHHMRINQISLQLLKNKKNCTLQMSMPS